MIFLRTCPTTDTGPGAVWKIPEEIHSRDLLPHYTSLAKKAAISWARGKLFDQWDEEEKAEQAAAEQKAKGNAFGAACMAKMQEENRVALAAFQADAAQEEHDPVLERLMAEARAIREAPLSAFAADAGFGEDGEEIETPPVAQQRNPILERVKALQAETRAIREALGLDEDTYEGEGPIPWDR
jgi:hypothetical protein